MVLRLAIPKGRIWVDCMNLFDLLSLTPEEDKASRRLTVNTSDPDVMLLVVKVPDVLFYVSHEVSDVGILGSDELYGKDLKGFFMKRFNSAGCFFSLASCPTLTFKMFDVKIATKYLRFTKAVLYGLQRLEMVKLSGSLEIGPWLGMVDLIVDIVSSGKTLRDNGLVEVNRLKVIHLCWMVRGGINVARTAKVKALTRFISYISSFVC
jgi:ATP phosphoribosyltransferase